MTEAVLRAATAPLDAPPADAVRSPAHHLQIRDGDQVVATVVTSRRRQRAHLDRAGWLGAAASGDADRHDSAPADERAWPAASANGAAQARWRDLHPTLVTIASVTTAAGASADLAAVLDAAGAFLAEAGIRRLDLRAPADHPAVERLRRAGWVTGFTGGDVVASVPVRYPWSLADVPNGPTIADRLPRWIPRRVRRLVRRALALHPRRIPEIVRTAVAEAGAMVRNRHLTRRARSTRSDQAPDEAHPFGATRYRTIRKALAQVPPSFQATTFVDIGSGDGRVLLEASALGYQRVLGREVDPALAAQSAEALGSRGRVETGDALATPIPADVGVVFLNNPFAAPAVARLAELVAESIDEHPRPLLVVYLNPRTIEPFVAAGMVLVDAAPQYTVLASRRAT